MLLLMSCEGFLKKSTTIVECCIQHELSSRAQRENLEFICNEDYRNTYST